MYVECRCKKLKERERMEDLDLDGRKVAIFKYFPNNSQSIPTYQIVRNSVDSFWII
jgi:hypothetical protein